MLKQEAIYLLKNIYYNSDMKHHINRNGFTLAEVLITLGIIAVVAALTMPALMADYRNRVVETRLQKFYSLMNQAILQSITDNGEVESWSYFNNDQKDDEGNYVNQADKNDSSFQRYLAPYLKVTEKKEAKDYEGNKIYLYFLADGSSFSFAQHENRDIRFYPKNPEKCLKQRYSIGTCSFSFEFYPISNSSSWKYLYNKGMEPALYKWDGNEDTLYNDNERGCNTDAGNVVYCNAIIQRNGWKVPKDYPRRISF
ncbi:unknown [Clostridium sp. CAG:768]|nr:unknown [Clostridium sp. CAG:768]